MKRWQSYGYLIAAIVATAQAASASPLQPNIVVLVPPLTSYVGGVTKNVAAPQSLLTNFQDSHNFALSPTQAILLDKADVLIVPDLSMNPTFAGLVAKNKHVKVIELSHLDGANILPYPAQNPWLSKQPKDPNAKAGELPIVPKTTPATTAADAIPTSDTLYKKFDSFDNKTPEVKPEVVQGAIDPHFWLDPERMASIALPLARELSVIYPTQQTTFELNAKNLSQHIREEVIPGMQEVLTIPRTRLQRSTGEIIPFLPAHPGYQYFLTRFNLPYNGEIMTRPNEFIGGKTLENILKVAANTQIRCVMTDSSTPLSERVARASGARISIVAIEQSVSAAETPPLPWLRNDYDRLMYKTTKAFADCL